MAVRPSEPGQAGHLGAPPANTPCPLPPWGLCTHCACPQSTFPLIWVPRLPGFPLLILLGLLCTSLLQRSLRGPTHARLGPFTCCSVPYSLPVYTHVSSLLYISDVIRSVPVSTLDTKFFESKICICLRHHCIFTMGPVHSKCSMSIYWMNELP